MKYLVLPVLAVLAAAAGGGDAVDPRYGSQPVYSQKSSLLSRWRPFQSSLRPVPPYGAPYEYYPQNTHVGYPLKPYGGLSRLPAGAYRQSPYGGLAPVTPNGGLSGPLIRDYSKLPYGDHSKLPYGDYPKLPYGDYPKLPYGDYPKLPYGDYPKLPYGDYPKLPYGDYPKIPYENHPSPLAGLYPPPPYSAIPAPLINDVYPRSRYDKYLEPLLGDAVSPPIYPTKYHKTSSNNYPKPSFGGYPKANVTTTGKPYSFSYGLVDVRGNDFGAAEESNGDEVQGQYSVLLPDGRLQTVSYSVQGDSGFVADVKYEGEAKFVDEDGKEEGRSTVKRGRGPTDGYQDRYHD